MAGEFAMSDDSSLPELQPSAQIDTTVSHSARIWDYWLGGKDNYPVDREVGDQIAEMLPDIVQQARADRMFLGRGVRYLAGEAGVRPLLGVGIRRPNGDHTSECRPPRCPACPSVHN